MAQTGYTPIQLYYSTTASAAPTAANLLPGELGLNITDGKLYYEDNLGAVQVLADTTRASGTLSVANGGTGGTTFTANNVLLGNGTSAFQVVAPGTSGNVLTSNGTTWVSSAPGASLFGVTDSATPYETSLGYEAGNAVTTGEYSTFVGYRAGLVLTTGSYNTAIGGLALDSNITGSSNTAVGFSALGLNTQSGSTAVGMQALSTSQSGSTQNTALGYRAGQTISSGSNNILIGYNAGNPGFGTDLTSGQNNIIIGNAIDLGSSSASNQIRIGNATHNKTQLFGVVELNAAIIEASFVNSGQPGATFTFDVLNESVVYFNQNVTSNWVINVRGNGSYTFGSLTQSGDSVTIAMLVTNGATAYYPTGFQVDGVTRTVKWQGGTAPTAGNPNSVDAYVYSIFKIGTSYTVFGSQTKFA